MSKEEERLLNDIASARKDINNLFQVLSELEPETRSERLAIQNFLAAYIDYKLSAFISINYFDM